MYSYVSAVGAASVQTIGKTRKPWVIGHGQSTDGWDGSPVTTGDPLSALFCLFSSEL